MSTRVREARVCGLTRVWPVGFSGGKKCPLWTRKPLKMCGALPCEVKSVPVGVVTLAPQGPRAIAPSTVFSWAAQAHSNKVHGTRAQPQSSTVLSSKPRGSRALTVLSSMDGPACRQGRECGGGSEPTTGGHLAPGPGTHLPGQVTEGGGCSPWSLTSVRARVHQTYLWLHPCRLHHPTNWHVSPGEGVHPLAVLFSGTNHAPGTWASRGKTEGRHLRSRPQICPFHLKIHQAPF